MREVQPEVYLIAKPELDPKPLLEYLRSVNGEAWADTVTTINGKPAWNDAQQLIEGAGRMCYRSWKPGLNPNVTKVRTDQGDYLENILKSGHGSVLEHANFTFIFANVSRVFTHELVRHRAGTAISQESMRYVRLDDIPFWFPDWYKEAAQTVPVIMELDHEIQSFLAHAEELQRRMAVYFGLNDPDTPFHEKKAKTSFMRRFAPDGVATTIEWTANIRTLRHVIETRTAMGAEEEIRLVFSRVAEIMIEECPALFGDFEQMPATKEWRPRYRKV